MVACICASRWNLSDAAYLSSQTDKAARVSQDPLDLRIPVICVQMRQRWQTAALKGHLLPHSGVSHEYRSQTQIWRVLQSAEASKNGSYVRVVQSLHAMCAWSTRMTIPVLHSQEINRRLNCLFGCTAHSIMLQAHRVTCACSCTPVALPEPHNPTIPAKQWLQWLTYRNGINKLNIPDQTWHESLTRPCLTQ